MTDESEFDELMEELVATLDDHADELVTAHGDGHPEVLGFNLARHYVRMFQLDHSDPHMCGCPGDTAPTPVEYSDGKWRCADCDALLYDEETADE